jgi:hypothetical protein
MKVFLSEPSAVEPARIVIIATAAATARARLNERIVSSLRSTGRPAGAREHQPTSTERHDQIVMPRR